MRHSDSVGGEVPVGGTPGAASVALFQPVLTFLIVVGSQCNRRERACCLPVSLLFTHIFCPPVSFRPQSGHTAQPSSHLDTEPGGLGLRTHGRVSPNRVRYHIKIRGGVAYDG
jgi:hypothetical protein